MKRLIHNLCLMSLLSLSYTAHALESDMEQPIYVDAKKQSIDMKNNKVIFTGDVAWRQGSIKLDAERLLIIQTEGTNELKYMEATGKLVYFEQQMDDGTLLKGYAEKMTFTAKTETLIMLGKAKLVQDTNTITGNKIDYHLSSQRLKAESGGGERTSTTIIPPAKKR